MMEFSLSYDDLPPITLVADRVIRHVCDLLQKNQFSQAVGVTGSMAYGTKKVHDIDLIVLVKRTEFFKFVHDLLSEKVIYENCDLYTAGTLFANGYVDVVFLRRREEGIPITIEVYAVDAAERMARLEEFRIIRYRDYLSNTSRDYLSHNASIHVDFLHLQQGADILSIMPNIVLCNNEYYLGQHPDKLFSAIWIQDKVNIKKAICTGAMKLSPEERTDEELFHYFNRRERFNQTAKKAILRRIWDRS